MEIDFNNGSQVKIIKSDNTTRGKRSQGIKWFALRSYIDFLLMYGFDLHELREFSDEEIERLVEKVAEPFVKAAEIEE